MSEKSEIYKALKKTEEAYLKLDEALHYLDTDTLKAIYKDFKKTKPNETVTAMIRKILRRRKIIS